MGKDKPGGGWGKFISRVMSALWKTRASWVVPSHPGNTKVKHIFQSHTTILFCVGCPFLPINFGCSLALTTHGTWVLSIAPMHS